MIVFVCRAVLQACCAMDLEGACTGLVLAVEVAEHTGDWGHCSGVRLQRLGQGRAGVRTGGGMGGGTRTVGEGGAKTGRGRCRRG